MSTPRPEAGSTACGCEGRRLPLRGEAWHAVSAILFAALVPKCPACVLGLLAVVGAGGLEATFSELIDERRLLIATIASLAAAIGWLAWRRGLTGAVVAT